MDYDISIETAPTLSSIFFRDGSVAEYVYETKTIYLYSVADENIIESVINHELFHHIIAKLENMLTAMKFDAIFHDIPIAEDVSKYVEECGVPVEKAH